LSRISARRALSSDRGIARRDHGQGLLRNTGSPPSHTAQAEIPPLKKISFQTQGARTLCRGTCGILSRRTFQRCRRLRKPCGRVFVELYGFDVFGDQPCPEPQRLLAYFRHEFWPPTPSFETGEIFYRGGYHELAAGIPPDWNPSNKQGRKVRPWPRRSRP